MCYISYNTEGEFLKYEQNGGKRDIRIGNVHDFIDCPPVHWRVLRLHSSHPVALKN